MRAEFERVGRGAVLNNSPYDLAAAALILDEAGVVLTDATGRGLGDRRLLGSGHDFQMSWYAPPTPSCTPRSSPRSTPGSAAAGDRPGLSGPVASRFDGGDSLRA